MNNNFVHVNNCENVQPLLGMDDTRKRCREHNRCLSCFPIDILLIILSYLSVGDYVSFRCVCKSWQSAFLEYSPLISQKKAKRKELPWFVILKLDPNSKELETTGKIGGLFTRRIYTTGIPELFGSRILSSKHGWLLLFSNRVPSLFFLNPFSRARIDIPLLVDDMTEDLTRPGFFDTSAPPTSPDCVVFSARNCKDGMLKISTCRRGESVWKTNTYDRPSRSSSPRVVNAVFFDGVWYCLHERGCFSAFYVVTRVWEVITTPLKGIAREERLVSHVCKSGNRVYLCVYGYNFYEVRLLKKKEMMKNKRLKLSRSYSPDPFWPTRHESHDYIIRTSPEKAFMQQICDRDLKVDTFNPHAWCININNNNKNKNNKNKNKNDTAVKDDDGGEDVIFRWHGFKSWADDFFLIRDFKLRCSHPQQENGPNDDDHCSTFITWLEPIWVQPSINLSWMS